MKTFAKFSTSSFFLFPTSLLHLQLHLSLPATHSSKSLHLSSFWCFFFLSLAPMLKANNHIIYYLGGREKKNGRYWVIAEPYILFININDPEKKKGRLAERVRMFLLDSFPYFSAYTVISNFYVVHSFTKRIYEPSHSC